LSQPITLLLFYARQQVGLVLSASWLSEVSVRLSVRLSITFCDSIKTVQAIIESRNLHCRLYVSTLVSFGFCNKISCRWARRFLSN